MCTSTLSINEVFIKLHFILNIELSAVKLCLHFGGHLMYQPEKYLLSLFVVYRRHHFFFKLDHAFLKKELVSIVVKEKHLRSDYRFGKVGTIHELICH